MKKLFLILFISLFGLTGCSQNSSNYDIPYVQNNSGLLYPGELVKEYKADKNPSFDVEVKNYKCGTIHSHDICRINFKIVINKVFNEYKMDYIQFHNDSAATTYYFDSEFYGSISYYDMNNNELIGKYGVRILNEGSTIGFYIKKKSNDREVKNVVEYNYYCINDRENQKDDHGHFDIIYKHNNTSKAELHDDKINTLDDSILNSTDQKTYLTNIDWADLL